MTCTQPLLRRLLAHARTTGGLAVLTASLLGTSAQAQSLPGVAAQVPAVAPAPPLTVPPLACAAPLPTGITAPRALWLWSAVVATDAAEQQKFLAFAQSHGVRTVFITGPGVVAAPGALATFTAAAQQACIQVELLYGASSQALTAGHAKAIAETQAAIAAIQQLPGPRPVGLHFDIEPYTLPQWSANLNSIANQYLDLLEKLVPLAHQAGLRLSVDVPFWYDTKQVTRAGVTRPLSQWVADRVDRMVLMDYRDTAQGMISMGQAEVAYATSIGREVLLGAETMCGLSPTLVTFCEEGGAKLDATLLAVQAAFAGQTGFGGIGVHHYGSWRALKL